MNGTNRSICGSKERRIVSAAPFRSEALFMLGPPLPHLAFEGRQGAFDDLAKRHAVREFAGLVAKALAFDDLVKAVVRALRDPCIEKHGAAGFCVWSAA